ncbi:flagellar biosynthesis protein FlhG [Caldicellulosiruptor bescii]|uniref:Cobyrinic acid ac-diamide synthase n=2 Tax=Caldicellulosiruptor bescii TaxID=31899 RepID=B9MM03_CALBD|nr:MinD/ParA family protein [Caldicellulosiruptor bescii]ACM61226.1 Cobyrinic acid ac-diamide synthase [Caldicellulosiruptor bescii DSM 6725]PBC88961.1 flagellar biosynthesis protein FlhG [Caldicellulosiruptor bescii]PBC91557.1 flagellar biosynthesis protein FlhG [Caldicellulosiruptor bescii]PBD03030.1 flagellar biosynthesis protein FlhG [Caldicellulosiruptor bescii]PBD07355.1 flagellar biosynthesis protein FlhG [Caldicellulosiruptor bescii]
MRDQAQGLRNLVRKAEISTNIPAYQGTQSKVVTITSGKGGVGKTNLTVNLAIALKKMGKRVLIIDADLGLSNVEVLLGTSPKYNVKDVLEGKKDIFSIVEEGPLGINFISGGSGIVDLANLDEERLLRLIECAQLINKSFDVVLIDTGAGISRNVMEFVMMSDEVIVITTPEPTSITDAYAIIKAIIARDFNHKINLLVNRVNGVKEAEEIFFRLNSVIKRFLQREVEYIGYIEENSIVSKSVIKQVPFMISYEKSNISRQVENVAMKLVKSSENVEEKNRGGFSRFIDSIIKRLREK